MPFDKHTLGEAIQAATGFGGGKIEALVNSGVFEGVDVGRLPNLAKLIELSTSLGAEKAEVILLSAVAKSAK